MVTFSNGWRYCAVPINNLVFLVLSVLATPPETRGYMEYFVVRWGRRFKAKVKAGVAIFELRMKRSGAGVCWAGRRASTIQISSLFALLPSCPPFSRYLCRSPPRVAKSQFSIAPSYRRYVAARYRADRLCTLPGSIPNRDSTSPPSTP
ncbi:hypothetical protein GGI35DRAFT_102142 [Trichoderma velutinum]